MQVLNGMHFITWEGRIDIKLWSLQELMYKLNAISTGISIIFHWVNYFKIVCEWKYVWKTIKMVWEDSLTEYQNML